MWANRMKNQLKVKMQIYVPPRIPRKRRKSHPKVSKYLRRLIALGSPVNWVVIKREKEMKLSHQVDQKALCREIYRCQVYFHC